MTAVQKLSMSLFLKVGKLIDKRTSELTCEKFSKCYNALRDSSLEALYVFISQSRKVCV